MLCPVLLDLHNRILKPNFYFQWYQSHIPLLCLIILQHLLLLSQEMIIDYGIAQSNNTGFVTLITNLELLNGPSLIWSCLNLSNHGNLSHDNDKPCA